MENITHITLGDLDELVRLHAEYLNYGDGIRPHYDKILRDPDNVALKYVAKGGMAGLLIYTKGIALSGNHRNLVERLMMLSKGKTVYTGDAVLVKKECRGMGIADELCAAMLRELKSRGVQLALHEFWVYPDGRIPALRMCRVYTNSVFLGRFENFYRDFHHYGYICPICGKECVCAAEIYLAEIPGEAAP